MASLAKVTKSKRRIRDENKKRRRRARQRRKLAAAQRDGVINV